MNATNLQRVGRWVKSATGTRASPTCALSSRTSWWGIARKSSSIPSSCITSSVEGWMVSPRKSRRKSACFSRTRTSTPARASRSPSIIPAGPPPAMQHPHRSSTCLSQLKNGLAGVYHERGAGNVGGLVAGQKEDRVGDLPRLRPAPEEVVARALQAEVGLRDALCGGPADVKGRDGSARAHRVHADAVRRLLDGQRARESEHGGLGRVVLAHAGPPLDAVHRRDVDDGGPSTGPQ